MTLNNYPKETRLNESAFRFISSLLVAAMLTCFTLTVSSLLSRIFPAWQSGALAVVAFFVAIDRLYTYRRLKSVALFSSEWIIAYGTQWVVIVAALKLVTGLANGPDALLAEIQHWAGHFADYFFTLNFLVALALIFVIWILSGSFAELLDEMGVQQAQILLDMGSAAYGEIPARERLLSLVFSVCTFLVFITGLVRVNLRVILGEGAGEALFFTLPPLAGGAASTLLYFMLGLALLSQTQFMDLNTRWSLARIPVSEKMAGRWALYSLLFLAILAALASLLPTSYSLGLIAVLGYLFSVIAFLVQLVISLLILLISLPFLLLGRQSPVTNPIRPTPPPAPDALGQAAASAPLPWLELFKSVAFWAFLLGMIAFAVIQYARQHRELLRQLPGWEFWSKAWDWLRGLFGGIKTGFSKAVESGLERLRARRGAVRDGFSSGFLNLGRLAPRQRIYFFYLALIRRSGESGLPRSLSQTPAEFAATLDHALPASEPDIDALTAAFVEARYSRHPVEAERANLVKATWERLRKAFRGHKAEK